MTWLLTVWGLMLTGKIVLAHFYESLDYYQRLEVAELEGDILKALAAGDPRLFLASVPP